MNAVQKLEQAMQEYPEVELEVRHHFAPGVYARELLIPKGVLLTGKIHKTEHLNILAKGRIMVSNMGESKELSAPLTFVSPPGTKRAGYALEDSVWITIHVTEHTDLDMIEQEVIAESYEALEYETGQIEEMTCLG